MASYVPRYGKKRERLAELERELTALLQTEAEAARVAEAAQAVRAARVRALKAKRAELAPSEKNTVAVENLEREIQFWLWLPVEQVIDGYRTGKLRGHRAAAVRRAIHVADS